MTDNDTVAVLCTGPSLSAADVEQLRGVCRVVAVSDAVYLAPWADALVSYDRAWWVAHADTADKFRGKKYHCHVVDLPDMEAIRPGGGNSGCLGLLVAYRMGAKKILLLGADLKGSHFFGPHTRPGLRNTELAKFDIMRRQFDALRTLPVINCSSNSALACFPFGSIDDHVPQRATA